MLFGAAAQLRGTPLAVGRVLCFVTVPTSRTVRRVSIVAEQLLRLLHHCGAPATDVDLVPSPAANPSSDPSSGLNPIPGSQSGPTFRC